LTFIARPHTRATLRRIAPEVLTQRRLNRTLLHRQGLLARSGTPALEMVERLVGMQAQVPENPYVGLWSRLREFDPLELSGLIADRRLARAGLMRNTLHLVSARDCLAIHPLTTPLRIRTFWPPFGKGLNGADVDEVVAAGRALLASAPRTRAALSEHLAERWPEAEPLPLAYAVTHHLPLVQITPRGLWKQSAQATWALADDWLGAPVDPEPDAAPYVLRYLAAFGPASPADVRTWIGITGLRAVIDSLRPQLRSFRDESGRELLDVPDGELADPDTPAPPRFLPEYDNVTLSFAERSRILAGLGPGLPFPRGSTIGSLLVDGFYRADWRAADGVLTIDRFSSRAADSPDTIAAIEAEGVALLRFLDPGVTDPRVEFEPAP
jgi:Winged helix DNA-binding domain